MRICWVKVVSAWKKLATRLTLRLPKSTPRVERKAIYFSQLRGHRRASLRYSRACRNRGESRLTIRVDSIMMPLLFLFTNWTSVSVLRTAPFPHFPFWRLVCVTEYARQAMLSLLDTSIGKAPVFQWVEQPLRTLLSR